MRPIRETIPLDEALAPILDAAHPIARTERVPLDQAHGRVIAVPPVAADGRAPLRSRRDGRLRGESPKTPSAPASTNRRSCAAIEKVYTGQVPTKCVGAGECIEIATGAPMPRGWRRGRDGRGNRESAGTDDVRIFTPVYPRQHVGRRAADITAGNRCWQPVTCSTRAA